MSRSAVLRFTAGWFAATLAVVGLALWLLRDSDPDVTLPPVRYTELSTAARDASCEFRRGPSSDARIPPVTGPPGPSARPGVYSRAPAPSSLVGALRRGVVIVYYRPSLARERIEEIQRLQKAVPAGTIVAPNATMPYVVAVTAWRQLLGCSRFAVATVDAVRLFRGRFVGSGPETDPGPPD